MLDIGVILRDLALKRPVFHSEADFQHAVAWEVHSRWPELSVRLEFRPPHMDNRTYVDIWCNAGSRAVVLELKYKTRKLDVNVAGEAFDLLDQSAHDIGRYDFLKDVMRLERIVADRTGLAGCSDDSWGCKPWTTFALKPCGSMFRGWSAVYFQCWLHG
jgi:hypothetical protein